MWISAAVSLSLNENSANEVIRIETQWRLLSTPPVLSHLFFMSHVPLKAAEGAGVSILPQNTWTAFPAGTLLLLSSCSTFLLVTALK